VYLADVFHAVFKPDPMNAKVGRRYRHQVLEKGGSLEGVEMLTEFLGRRPCEDAFNVDLGLEA
jgi:metallopeptidase MepB